VKRALLALLASLVVGAPAGAAPRARDLIDCTCYDLVRVATDQSPRVVFENSGQNIFDVSMRSRRVVYAGNEGRLYVSPLGVHRPRLLDARIARWAVFSRDGRRVAYGVNGCGLCVVDADGANRHALPLPGAGGPAAWRGDGRRLAFVVYDSPARAEGWLTTATPAGTTPRRLARGTNFGAGTSIGAKLVWAPRGNRIAYLSGLTPRVHVAVDGRPGQRSVALGVAPAWSPDARRLAIVAHGAVVVARADGTHAHPLDARAVDPYGFGVAWSPGGKRIAYSRYVGGRYQIAIAWPDGAHRHVLTTEEQDMETGPIYWSPDGETLTYSRLLSKGE
jgi:hypothetical protein